MSDSERIRELEGKLRTWQRSALALVGATLLAATAGVAVAQRIVTFEAENDPTRAIPTQSVLLELQATKDLTITGKTLEFTHSTRSYDLSGPALLRWGAGNSLSVGSAYRTRLERIDPTAKEGPVRISLTASPNPAQ